MKTLAKFKFCLTRLVMLLICLWALAPQASATWYIYGEAPFGGWDVNNGTVMTETGNSNLYRAIVNLTASSTKFTFSTGSGVWDGTSTCINSNRWGAYNDQIWDATVGEVFGTKQGKGDVRVTATGSHIFTFNDSGSDVHNLMVLSNPGTMYLLGSIASRGISWNPEQGSAMSTTDGINYTINDVVLAEGDEFSFTMKLGSSSDDWSGANSMRFGPSTTRVIEEGSALQMTDFGIENNYTVSSTSAGTYDISVNILTCKATITKHTVPTYTATVYVYDTTAPTLNGETMTTEDGRNCVWYKGTVRSTSTLTANIAGSGTLNATLQDGETYYYYWNGTSYVATDIDYNPYADRSFTIYVATKNAPEGFVPYMYAWYYIGQSKKEPKGAFTTGQQVNNNLMILNQTTEINGYTYWYETFTGIDKLNVIIHNNDGVQTADILNINADRYIIFDYNMQNEGQPYYNEATPKPAPQNFTIHVIEKNGKTPYLYVWDKYGNKLNGNFPGTDLTATETLNGETWYTLTVNAEDNINVIASLGSVASQTADITNWTSADLYIVLDGSQANQADRLVSTSNTAPTQQVQDHHTFTLYARSTGSDDVLHAYVYGAPGEANGSWTDAIVAPLDTEVLADGLTWYKYTLNTLASSYSVVLYNGTDSKQTVNITDITDSVRYVVVLDDDLAENKYNVTYTTLPPTDKMYVIGKAGGNPWSTTNGLEMTKDTSTGKFTLNNVQIIAGADFAFAAALTGEDEWDKLNLRRLTSIGNPTYDLTESQLGQPLALRLHNGSDNNNFKILETAYYDISLDPVTLKVTITRKYGALYMFYGDSNSPYWKPNAGVPMFTTDGKTFMLTNVELDEGDTFQFATHLGVDESTWPADTYRYGANSAGNNNWLVTESQIDVVLEDALRAETGKDFQMGSSTAGTYRVMVNPEAKTVALYRMADVTGSKVIIHLEKTSNVTNPKIWAYDKERDATDSLYIHVDRPSRTEIATNRHMLRDDDEPDSIVTVGGRQWWTWEVDKAITDFWFTRNGYNYASVQATALENDDMTDIQWRRSGEIFLTWPTTGTAMEDYTRDYYPAAAQEAPECAVMIEGHMYAYFTNTPGWAHVFCHAWYTDDQGVNHDLLTPPAPYEGGPCYPGALCEMIGYDKDGYEVWRIDLTAHSVTQYPNGGILFNNGIDDNHEYEHDMNHDYYTGTGTLAAKEQSSDFAYSTGACYDYCGLIVLGRSLSNIIRNGVVNGPVYTIEDDIVGVWFDPNAETVIEVDGETHTMYGALYCKDLNNFVTTPYVEKSIQKDGEIDYVLQLTNLMAGKNRYDQSNWVKLTLSTQYPGVLEEGVLMSKENQLNILRSYKGFVLPAESVHGQLVNNVNPEMRLALHALPTGNLSTNNYNSDPNVFITSNFVGTQECKEGEDEYGHIEPNTYFFVTPKPQEYAEISWAVYAVNDKFYVPKRGYVDEKNQWMNEGNLDGYFPVQWDLMEKPGLVENQVYRLNAIIRLAVDEPSASEPSGVMMRDDQQAYKVYEGTVPYVVSPIEILEESSIITAVNEVNTTKTVRQVRYYNLAGIEGSVPFDGVNVVVTTFTDGSKTTTKMLK